MASKRDAGDLDLEILTYLVVEFDESLGRRVDDVIVNAGGQLLHAGTSASPDAETAVATFYLASDAARAALEITSPASAGASRLRAALCTGRVEGLGTSPARSPVHRAGELLARAEPGQVLVAASTAVMAGPALPSDVNLIEKAGLVSVAGPAVPAERIYELRRETTDANGAPVNRASSLEWARRTARCPVIGRAEALARLEGAWTASCGGDVQTILLSGEPGIGKTMVTSDLALRVHARGGLVLYGRWDPNRARAYQALHEALGTYVSRCPDSELRAELGKVMNELTFFFPELSSRVERGLPSASRPEKQDERGIFESVAEWFRTISSRCPTLVVLDDFHWADRPSLFLLDYLSQTMGGTPLMIVATGRGKELEAGYPADLLSTTDPKRGGTGARCLELDGLDVPFTRAYIEHVLGQAVEPDCERHIEWLTDAATGNPLFITTFLSGLAGIRSSAGLSGALRSARDTLPGGFASVVHWRLNQLPSRVGEVLCAAADLGRDFELGQLAEATGNPPVMLRVPLDHAVRACLIRPGPSDLRYSFVHHLVYQVLRDGEVGQRRHAAPQVRRQDYPPAL